MKTYKRILSIALSVLMMLSLIPATVFAKSADPVHNIGYILTNKDSVIDFSKQSFTQEGASTLIVKSIASVSVHNIDDSTVEKQFIIDGVSYTPKTKGVHLVEVSFEEISAKTIVPIVVKNAEDKDYVLFNAEYSKMNDGNIPNDYKLFDNNGNSSAEIKDGKLMINAELGSLASNYGVVYFPEYLKYFGDYEIKANINISKASTPSRWCSVIYRSQANDTQDYPYYQMAVRQDATVINGVEFAQKKPDSGWNVIASEAFTESLASDKNYEFKVITQDNMAYEFINNKLIVSGQMEKEYNKGKVGLQANGENIAINSVNITLKTEKYIPPVVKDKYIPEVYEPQSGYVIAPTVLTEIKNVNDLAKLDNAKTPSTAILSLDQKGNVVSNNDFICTFEEFYSKLNKKIIPAFRVENLDQATQVANVIQDYDLLDSFVLAKDIELILAVKENVNTVKGIYEYEPVNPDKAKLTTNELFDAMAETNMSNSKVILIDDTYLDREAVEYLQKRLITVYAKASEVDSKIESGKGSGDLLANNLIVSTGINGVLTSNPQTFINAYEKIKNEGTLVRRPFIVGHRGVPSIAPENSVEGAIKAYELGADMIENDIWLSKDGVPMVMHDGTLDRTTNMSGHIRDYTYAELKEKGYIDWPHGGPDVKIPSLEEFIVGLKDTDAVHFVELKGYNNNAYKERDCIEAAKAVIEKHNAQDQIVFIAFDTGLAAYARELMPWASVAALEPTQIKGESFNVDIERAFRTLVPNNFSFDGSYSKLDAAGMEKMSHRGITANGWTFRAISPFYKYFKEGLIGITTDYSQWSTNMPYAFIDSSVKKINVNTFDSIMAKETALTYGRKPVELTLTDAVVLNSSKEDMFTETQNGIVAVKEGTAEIMFEYTYLDERKKPVYKLLTSPYEVTVNKSIDSELRVTGMSSTNGKVNLTATNEVSVDEISHDVATVELKFDSFASYELYLDKEATKKITPVREETFSSTIDKVVPVYNIEVPAVGKVIYIKLQSKLEDHSRVIPVNLNKIKLTTPYIEQINYKDPSSTGDLQFEVSKDKANIVIKPSQFATVELYTDNKLVKEIDSYDTSKNLYKFQVKTKNPVNNYYVKLKNPLYEHVVKITFKRDYEAPNFTDDKLKEDGYWGTEYVNYVKDLGVVKGDAGTTLVRPEDTANRIEGVIMILNYLGVDSSYYEELENPFVDISSTSQSQSWMIPYTNAAYYTGITLGYIDDETGKRYFKPASKISREQYFVMFARSLNMPVEVQGENETDEAFKARLKAELNKAFSDADKISDWAYAEILACNKAGVATGDIAHNFMPKNDLKRIEVMAGVAKHLGFQPGEKMVINNLNFQNKVNGRMGDLDGPAYAVYSDKGYNKVSFDVNLSEIDINTVRKSDKKFLNAFIMLGVDIYDEETNNYWTNCVDSGLAYMNGGDEYGWHLFHYAYDYDQSFGNQWVESRVKLNENHDYRITLDCSKQDGFATLTAYDLTDNKIVDSLTYQTKFSKKNGKNLSFYQNIALDYPEDVKLDTNGNYSEDNFTEITLYNTNEGIKFKNININNTKLYNANNSGIIWDESLTDDRGLWPTKKESKIDYVVSEVIINKPDSSYTVNFDMNKK